jgi:hypothetical protein
MKLRIARPVNFILAISVCTVLVGCTQPIETEAPVIETAAPEPLRPAYQSSKRLSSDCGVVRTPGSAPGLAPVAGAEIAEMPPPVAKFLAIGADREPVETDMSRVSDGYVLVEPWVVKASSLINNDKEVIASISGDYFRGQTQILENGDRLVNSFGMAGHFKGDGESGCAELYSSDGDLIWRVNINSENYISHHDVVLLPNGNFLAPVWERVPNELVIDQGRNPEAVDEEDGHFWFDGIVEVDPYAVEIVWEWSIKHHLVQEFDAAKRNYGVVDEHPELLDLNKHLPDMETGDPEKDWIHFNAVDYDPVSEQILISSPHLSEIYVIDHSTTPREATGHTGGRYGNGGDLLFRWGNPANYNRGGDEERTLFDQHDAHWIADGLNGAGNIMVFNNGDPKVRPHSTVVEIKPEMNSDGSYVLGDREAYGPQELVWEYNPVDQEQFFSFFISGAQRLPNGNTLVNQGAAGKIREVTPDGDIVWDYHYRGVQDANYMIFRAYKYPSDHPAMLKLIPASF